jgi:ribosomal protein S18 acetylase RimI-like enzyme
MTETDAALLRLLEPTDTLREAAKRVGGDVVRVGPFEAYVHPDPNAPGFGYAQPIEPLPAPDVVAVALRDLRTLFARHNALPVIEFNSPLFPRLDALLEADGFMLTDREPLMLLDPGDFAPMRAEGVEARFLRPDDPEGTLSAFARIFTEVLLERPYRETPEGISRLRAEVDRTGGRSHALALLNGVPTGTGFITTTDGVAEITRVATLPEARRRGVAGTLTSYMIEDHLRAEARMVWLTAAGIPAQCLYERLGFRLAGERLYFTAPLAEG